MMPKQNPERPFVIEIEDVRALDDENMEQLYLWVDQVALSKPKKHFSRDFADGVQVAEVVRYFLPKYVDLHNYVTSSATQAKNDNWNHLNRKVLIRLGLQLSPAVIRAASQAKPWVIEHVLCTLRSKIDHHLAALRNKRTGLDPEFLNWPASSRPDVFTGHTPRNLRAVNDFETLEEYYLNKGMKLFPKEPALEDKITNSKSLTPRQKKSILKFTEKVPREELDARNRAVAEKESTIIGLHNKIQRLEHMLYLKDIRIKDLSERLQSLEDHLHHHGPPTAPRGLARRPGPQTQAHQRGLAIA